LGKYRKLHLWNEEKLFFEPGDLGLPLFHTPMGRLGMLICNDMWFPEIPRIYALLGADLLAIPTNWPWQRKSNENADITDKLLVSHAHLNGVYIAACDIVGFERGTRFKGRSIIISNNGDILAGPASGEDEEIIKAECNIIDSRRKQRSGLDDLFGDRRTDIYDRLLGYKNPLTCSD
jgi:predicted amidohydrolase